MKQQFNPTTRKALVKALADILGTKQKYLGMPSAAYEIGEYHLAKDGLLTGPESAELLEALLAADFAPEAPQAEPAEEEAPEFPTEPELDRVVIEYPLDGFTPEKLDNLSKMITAKEELIKLAIGADTLPIQVLEDRVAFPWLQTADPEMVDALATFICALCKTALTKKRVTATPQPTGINDRYRFRCFMLHIGMIGSEYATARTKLLAPLQGNSGWLNGAPPKPEPAPEAEAEEAAAPVDEAPEEAPAEEAAAPEIDPPAEEAPQEAAPAEEAAE